MSRAFFMHLGESSAWQKGGHILWLPEGKLDRTGAKRFRLVMQEMRSTLKHDTSKASSSTEGLLETLDLAGTTLLTAWGVKSLLWWCHKALEDGHRTKICCRHQHQYGFFGLIDWPETSKVCLEERF